jgi:hypothetical protein
MNKNGGLVFLRSAKRETFWIDALIEGHWHSFVYRREWDHFKQIRVLCLSTAIDRPTPHSRFLMSIAYDTSPPV